MLVVKQDAAAIVQAGLNPSLVERKKLFKVDGIEQQVMKPENVRRIVRPETSELSTLNGNEIHQDNSKRPTS